MVRVMAFVRGIRRSLKLKGATGPLRFGR